MQSTLAHVFPPEGWVPRTVDGVEITVGLRVFTNNWRWGTVTALGNPQGRRDSKDVWHDVQEDGQHRPTIMNTDRLTTRRPR